VLGQGGILDTGIGIFEDLQSGSVAGLIGAVQKGGASYQTFKGKDLKSVVKEEATGALRDALRNPPRSVVSAANTAFTFPVNPTRSPGINPNAINPNAPR
jgi:hypothetical protein